MGVALPGWRCAIGGRVIFVAGHCSCQGPHLALRDMVRRPMMVVANGAKADIAFAGSRLADPSPADLVFRIVPIADKASFILA
jgi:hypothetical protein